MIATGLMTTHNEQPLKVGELARRTEVSVRTLHYYDEIGLLSPSDHTLSGHRLYTATDVARLLRIKSLQQLGFSLDEIRSCLDQPQFSARDVVRLHVDRLREQISISQTLCRRLEAIEARLAETETVSVDEFLQAIKEITMVDKLNKYYTPEQQKQLAERRKVVGEDRIREAEQEWKILIAAARDEMEAGTDPGSEEVQALAQQWRDLVNEFTAGDKGIERAVGRIYAEEPEVREMAGLDMELMTYMSRACALLDG